MTPATPMRRILLGLLFGLSIIGAAYAQNFGGLGGKFGKLGASSSAGPIASCNFQAASCSNISVSNSGGFALTSAGTLQLFSSNTARRTDLGLLIEPAATNLLLHSQDLANADWAINCNGVNGLSVTHNVAVGPDGTTTANLLTDVALNNQHCVYQAAGTAATLGTTYSWSSFFKAGTLSTGEFGGVIAGGDHVRAVFDVASGRVYCDASGTGVCENSGIKALGSGWYFISAQGHFTGSGATTIYTSAYTDQSIGVNNYLGTGATLYIWNAQMETGSIATSPIVTTTAGVTRSADVVTLAGVMQTAINKAIGAIVVSTYGAPAKAAGTLIGASGGVLLGKTSGDLATSTLTASISSPQVGRWPDQNATAISWDASGRILVLDGQSAPADSTAITPNTAQYLGSTAGSSSFCNCYIQSVAVYGTKLSLSKLQSLTPQGLPTLPVYASAFNYSNQTFVDDFHSISTIDVNDTRAAGFKWYTHINWPNFPNTVGTEWANNCQAVQSNAYAVADGVLKLNNFNGNGCVMGWELMTAASQAGAPGYVGNAFKGSAQGGLCAEVRGAFNSADQTAGAYTDGAWPAVWSMPLEQLTGTMAIGNTLHMVEVDGMLANDSGTPGVIANAREVHDWTLTPSANRTNNQTAHTAPVPPTPSTFLLTDYHTWGWCWHTAASNSGTGFYDFFFDGQWTNRQTYSLNNASSPAASPANPTGIFSASDFSLTTQDFISHVFNLIGGPNWPFYIDYFTIWQPTSVPYTPSSDSATTAWKNAVIALGGTVSAAQEKAVDNLIVCYKQNGIFSTWDREWLLASENTQQATVDLIHNANLTFVGSSTFVANAGITFPGSAGTYLDTGFNPTTAGGNYIKDSAAFDVYVLNSRAVGNTNNTAMGADNGAGAATSYISPLYSTGNANFEINGATFPFISNSNAQGLYTASRISSTTISLYKNGALLGSGASNSTALTNASIAIGADNSGGAYTEFTNDTIGMVGVGAGQTLVQAVTKQACDNMYATAKGFNKF